MAEDEDEVDEGTRALRLVAGLMMRETMCERCQETCSELKSQPRQKKRSARSAIAHRRIPSAIPVHPSTFIGLGLETMQPYSWRPCSGSTLANVAADAADEWT